MKSESRDVEANLVVDGGVLAKDNVPTDQPGDECVPAQLKVAWSGETHNTRGVMQ